LGGINDLGGRGHHESVHLFSGKKRKRRRAFAPKRNEKSLDKGTNRGARGPQ